MVEGFEGGLTKEELKALTSQIKEQESLLRLKRRWLMDLPLSTTEQKRVDEMLPPNDKILPESLLREDDVIYEDIITWIEKGFGAHKNGINYNCFQGKVQEPNFCYDFKDVSFLLDDMTNKGLCSFVKILTGGTIKFEKTNWSMKRTIKEFLPKVISDKNDISKAKLKQLSLLLRDPTNFRGNQMVGSTACEAYRAAAVKVLDGLEDFPSRPLSAMHRKLRGVKGYIPTMYPSKSGLSRDLLISRVKKRCMKMLLALGEADEPSEPLASALGVASLTLKFILNHQSNVKEFRKFSPEMEALQNDIAKSIHLLHEPKKVSLVELKKVQFLLDPNSDLSARSLRMAVRNLLTEYLFECSDMDEVPDFLVETLDIINRRSRLSVRKKRSSSEIDSSPRELMKEVIQKEVECVLCISAQAKEVVLNLLPEHEFDEGFAHAYMEDFEGSGNILGISDDEDDDQGRNNMSEDYDFHSDNSYEEAESIGETNHGEVNSPFLSPNERLNSTLESMRINKTDSNETSCSSKVLDSLTNMDLSSSAKNSSQQAIKSEETTNPVFSDLPLEEKNLFSHERGLGNQYLEVQEACDVTSMAAYRFVGHVLDKLAQVEGLELYQGDRSYLRSCTSVPEDSEESPHTLLTSKFPEMWKDAVEQ